MNPLKVCYVSSEVAPFTPPAELAFYSKSLPSALKDLEQDVRLMMPKYKSINERKFVLREVIRLREVDVSLNGNGLFANGKTAFLPNSKVHVYFLSVPKYFDKKGVYADPKSGKAYSDNAERFAYFCMGVLETLKRLYWQPDIIHCAGWSTALIPFYLKTQFAGDEFFQDTRTVLTVHNFSEQGEFPLKSGANIGIPDELLAKGAAFEANGKINFLKGGLTYADVINTVSEQYCKEIFEDPTRKIFGMENILAERSKDFYGIPNGANYSVWNPETDSSLPQTYDAKSLEHKSQSKDELREELELKTEDLPIVGFVEGFEANSGIELIAEALDEILKQKLQFVLVCNDETPMYKELLKRVKEHPGKLAVLESIDKATLHLLTAAADIMLFAAPGETGGNYHLNCLKYGTIPVAHNIGIFTDTLRQADLETGKGNSFLFEGYRKSNLLKALKEALKTHKDGKQWSRIQKSAMRVDFSWDATAKKYQKLYDKALKKK